MPGWKEISDFVLKYDYCCGCGVCAGVCPQNALEIRFNEYGEYRPYLIGNCTNCGLCSKVCPFANGNPNEDDMGKAQFAGVPGIKHTSEAGYYLGCCVGYSAVGGHRKNGASGGLATWTLETLLRLGEVDCVACVRPRRGGHPLFEFTSCHRAEEVRSCSRSSYYPVELSGVVRQIFSEQKRYAIIGLPCVCKALRLCAQANPRLRDRMQYVLGLTCGHGVSAHFSEYVFAMAGGKADELQGVAFRVKNPQRPVRDYGIVLVGKDDHGEHERQISWSQGPGFAFINRSFTPLACDFCDDAFAECADATFMDAWLPEYSDDREGQSIVLIRNRVIQSIIREHGQSECILQPIDISRVIESQKGTLRCKRQDLSIRRQVLEPSVNSHAGKRTHSQSKRIGCVRGLLVRAQWDIARQSSVLWNEASRQIDRFHQMTRRLQFRLLWLNRVVAFRRRPRSVLSKLSRRIGRSLRM